jgi:hypothetical protein
MEDCQHRPVSESALSASRRMLRRSLERRIYKSFPRIALRAAYGAMQLPRVAWYIGHGLAMRRLARAAQPKNGKSTRPPARTDAKVPDRRRLRQDRAALAD